MKTPALLTFLLISLSVFGQGNSTYGIQLHGFLPTGELKKDASEIWGAGFGSDIAFQINESPVYLGVSFDFTRYGSQVRTGFHNADLPDVRFRYHNEMWRLQPLVRIKPETNTRFLPYADFNFGAGYIITRGRIYDREFQEVVDQFVELDDFVFTYGLGGGVEYIVDELVSLDLFIRANFSNRAQYLTPKNIHYNQQAEAYDLSIQSSKFNSIIFGFGVKLLIREL